MSPPESPFDRLGSAVLQPTRSWRASAVLLNHRRRRHPAGSHEDECSLVATHSPNTLDSSNQASWAGRVAAVGARLGRHATVMPTQDNERSRSLT
jgi:hypothetical protein